MERIVAGESEQNAEARAQREEHLMGSVNPDLCTESNDVRAEIEIIPYY